MSKRDYYEVLGINRNADQKEIKKAYRRLAQKYHPDRNPNDKQAEKRFREISEAYEILSVKEKRTAYDQFGHSGIEDGQTNNNFNTGFSDMFGDVFGDIFGSSNKRSNAPQRGSDLRYKLNIELEEAIYGKKINITLKKLVKCNRCNGNRSEPGYKTKYCPSCKGVGQIRMHQGFFSIQQTCNNCHGNGEIIDKSCIKCNGEGRINDKKKLSIKIPPGVDNGDRIRILGEGESGINGGKYGDLYVQIAIKPHKIFIREGKNLYCSIPINFVDAALGGVLEVPTLEGNQVKLKIPAGTQTGKQFRIKGKGVKSIRSNYPGDLLCKVIIETPINLNKNQKELLRKFQKSIEKKTF
ncbi:Chaperone protein DnaJ [Candidatus Portiera aleyrodidarum]|uniref:molecular chaperone DnaJ n=1 Tax=Candidatus Portiera aleyrodidarum TaxID=91844 RepID=UPI0005D7903F|nr:molecular chaperone DnaJ [Candidatus Portiera aleyrodidarum]CEL12265.1 Chaperone protein DnaJ [Candidatus Portiera aleyrodidarum]